MRLLFLLASALLGSSALADRFITIPTGSKIPFRTTRAELMIEPTRDANAYLFLGIGIGKTFEIEIRGEAFSGVDDVLTADIAYNLNSPLVDLAPGISFGVLDLADNTSEGRRGYFAITIRQAQQIDFPGGTPLEFTVGASFGRLHTPFVGAMVPFSDDFRLLFEHSGYRLSAAMEFRSRQAPTIRLVFREHETLLSFSGVARF